MKLTQYALLGALLGAFSLSAVDCTTFDTVIELYKKQEVTRKDLINAYDQLADKRLGNQLLQVFLKTTISTLRTEEAQHVPQYNPPVPAPANHGRAECAGRGCAARTRRRPQQSPHSRPRRPRRARQEQRDLEKAKRRSIITAQQEREREEIETAKALSLVEAQPNEGVSPLSQASQGTRNDDLEEANRRSIVSAQQEQEGEEIETAQALSLVEARATENAQALSLAYQGARNDDLETAKALSLIEAAEQEERELGQAIAGSLRSEVPRRTQPQTVTTLGASQPSQTKPVGTPAKKLPEPAKQTTVQRPTSTADILERAQQQTQKSTPTADMQKRTQEETQQPRRVQEERVKTPVRKSKADILADAEAAAQQEEREPVQSILAGSPDERTPRQAPSETSQVKRKSTADILAEATQERAPRPAPSETSQVKRKPTADILAEATQEGAPHPAPQVPTYRSLDEILGEIPSDSDDAYISANEEWED